MFYDIWCFRFVCFRFCNSRLQTSVSDCWDWAEPFLAGLSLLDKAAIKAIARLRSAYQSNTDFSLNNSFQHVWTREGWQAQVSVWTQTGETKWFSPAFAFPITYFYLFRIETFLESDTINAQKKKPTDTVPWACCL